MSRTGMLAGLVLLAGLSSGCTVKCHFRKNFGVKGNVYSQECSGRIDVCPPPIRGARQCENRMRIECGGREVYDGPYTVDMRDNRVKYIATNWHGDRDDIPSIVSEAPDSSDLDVLAFEQDETGRGEGSCVYTPILGHR